MTRRKEVVAVAATAAVTMVCTLALMWPLVVGAAGQPVMRVAQPSISIGDCKFTVETPLSVEGSAPFVRFKAVNTAHAPTEATVWLVVSATSPQSEMSRRMPEPTTVWAHGCTVQMAAGATETYRVPIEAALPAGQSIMISLANTAPPVPNQDR
jgi:hypothetical protein